MLTRSRAAHLIGERRRMAKANSRMIYGSRTRKPGRFRGQLHRDPAMTIAAAMHEVHEGRFMRPTT